MGAGVWPGWVAVSMGAVSDLLMLASLRFDLDRERQPAGVIEALSWIVGTSPGPGSGRREGPEFRAVALCELCAAQCLVAEGSGDAPPPLREVCAELGVRYVPARTGDPGYGLGVYATLRWALGQTPIPPMRLPLRDAGGRVMDEEQIFAALVGKGMDSGDARLNAREMAADSQRLADLVRVRSAVPGAS